MKKSNVAVLIDGFNFYHAICYHMQHSNCSQSLKWLDYDTLIRSFILKNVDYDKLLINFYTAINTHKKDTNGKIHSSTLHHHIYCSALKSKNINVIEGVFKIRNENFNTYYTCAHCSDMQFIHKFNIDFPNKIYCKKCGAETLPSDIHCIQKAEEKKTDVKIAIDLVNIARDGIYDTIYLFSTDSDYIPAAEYIKSNCPNVNLIIVAPADKIPAGMNKSRPNYIFKYGTSEFQKLGISIFRLRLSKLANYLFEDEVVLSDGKILKNPWQ